MGVLIIADTQVGINKDGMYCLNHLHKAAMAQGKATESQRPGAFTQSQSNFIEAVDATGIASVKSVKGGAAQGTWACEIVAMKYAGWIDPAYEVQVYLAVQALKRGDLDKAVSISGSKEARRALDEKYRAQTIELQIKNAQALCEFLPHLGDASKQAIAATLVNSAAGMDVVPLPKIEEKFYTSSELAAEFEMTSAMLGRLANRSNMKVPEFGEYRLSKSRHSDKQVEQWYWNQSGRDAMRDVVSRCRS